MGKLPKEVKDAMLKVVRTSYAEGVAQDTDERERLGIESDAAYADAEKAILAALQSEREGALREAAEVAESETRIDVATSTDVTVYNTARRISNAILALALRPEPAAEPAPESEEREPILWLGDNTEDRWIWEMTRRRDRFIILGGPTTLYFKMDDGTNIIVPYGWWIYDWHTDHPRVSSAPPSPLSSEKKPS